MLLFPLILTLTIGCNRKKLAEKKFNKRCGNMYKNLSLKSAWQYMFNLLYLLRRLFFILSILFLQSSSFLQVSLQLLMSHLLLLYILHFRPFDDPFDTQLEVFNEFTISLVLYITLGAYFIPEKPLEKKGINAMLFLYTVWITVIRRRIIKGA